LQRNISQTNNCQSRNTRISSAPVIPILRILGKALGRSFQTLSPVPPVLSGVDQVSRLRKNHSATEPLIFPGESRGPIFPPHAPVTARKALQSLENFEAQKHRSRLSPGQRARKFPIFHLGPDTCPASFGPPRTLKNRGRGPTISILARLSAMLTTITPESLATTDASILLLNCQTNLIWLSQQKRQRTGYRPSAHRASRRCLKWPS
jgi:hypothetical protein